MFFLFPFPEKWLGPCYSWNITPKYRILKYDTFNSFYKLITVITIMLSEKKLSQKLLQTHMYFNVCINWGMPHTKWVFITHLFTDFCYHCLDTEGYIHWKIVHILLICPVTSHGTVWMGLIEVSMKVSRMLSVSGKYWSKLKLFVIQGNVNN